MADQEMLPEKITFLLLGWALGVFSPLIVDAYTRRREKREAREALRNELHELRYRLASVVQTIQTKLGQLDKKTLEWGYPIIRDYQGVNSDKQLLAIMEQLTSMSEEDIAAAAPLLGLKPGAGMALKKYSVPLLEEKLGQLSSFGVKLQSQLLEVRSSLSLFNDEVDLAREYFRVTFTNGVTQANYSRAEENLVGCYKNASARAKIIVDLIGTMTW